MHGYHENEDPPPEYDGKKGDDYALHELESPMVPIKMPTDRDPVEVEAEGVRPKPGDTYEDAGQLAADTIQDIRSPVLPASSRMSK